jgi:hypothetical protein
MCGKFLSNNAFLWLSYPGEGESFTFVKDKLNQKKGNLCFFAGKWSLEHDIPTGPKRICLITTKPIEYRMPPVLTSERDAHNNEHQVTNG